MEGSMTGLACQKGGKIKDSTMPKISETPLNIYKSHALVPAASNQSK